MHKKLHLSSRSWFRVQGFHHSYPNATMGNYTQGFKGEISEIQRHSRMGPKNEKAPYSTLVRILLENFRGEEPMP